MLASLTLLLVCQLVGTIIQQVFALPVPGAVIGMVILFVALVRQVTLPTGLSTTSQSLLGHLSLLFVPAGVGIIQQLSLLKQQWIPILAALILSSVVTLIVTGWVMQLCLKYFRVRVDHE